MTSRDAEFDIIANDKSARGISSVTARLAALEKHVDRTNKSLGQKMSSGGSDAASGFAASFVGRVGPLVAKAPIGPYVTAGLGAASPAISATLSAAIAGGAALGAVGIGAAIVSQRPEVQRATQSMMDSVFASLQSDAAPMVEPIIQGIAMIERRADSLRPTFRRIFADSARYAPTLFTAVDRSIDVLVRSFADIVARGGPVVDVLGDKLPQSATALAAAMRMATDETSNNAQTLGAVFTVLNFSIQTIGTSMKALNLVMKYTTGGQVALLNALGGGDKAAQGGTKSLQDYIAELNKAAPTTTTLAQATKNLADAAVSAYSAETRLGEALDEANNKAYNNSAGLDANTVKGRANREMLGNLAAAARDSIEAISGMTGSNAKSNEVMGRSYRAFMRTAEGMGVSKAEARALAAQLGLLPVLKQITIRTPGLPLAVVQAKALAAAISSIDTYKEIQIIQKLSTRGQRVAGITGRGGYTEFAAGAAWRPAEVAAKFAEGRSFAAGLSGHDLAPATPVESVVNVLLDGTPFYAMTARAISGSESRQAWRNRTGKR